MDAMDLLKHTTSQKTYTVLVWITSVLIFAMSFTAIRWRADQAPDIFTDEIIYTRLGIRLLGEGALVWDSGDPFPVHPPLYFLLESLYLAFTEDLPPQLYSAGDIFSSVYSARGLNAILSGLTAVILFYLGKRLHGFWFGLFLAALFILDPFAVRINRRAMLETLTALLVLSGITLLMFGKKTSTTDQIQRGFLAGLLLGLAILTKELAFVSLLAVLLFGIWEILVAVRAGWRFSPSLLAPLLAVPVAMGTYAIYPLWIATTGYSTLFMDEKILGVKRLLGLVQITGWNRPGLSLMDLLLRRLLDYGGSYFLLGLGGIATLYLLVRARNRREGRLLASWGLIFYLFFTFTALFGSGNDQFFYLLLVPAIVILGYAIILPIHFEWPSWIKLNLASPSQTGRSGPQRSMGKEISRSLPAVNRLVFAVLLILLVPYNTIYWGVAYGVGQDNGYFQITRFIQDNLPILEPLNASGDAVKFHYFFPDRQITNAATPQEARKMSVHYFVLVPKDVRSRYGRIQPELASWILANGERLFAVNGYSYGDIYLYRVDYPDQATKVKQNTTSNPPPNTSHWRSFQPAKGGTIVLFVSGLVLWILLCLIISVGLAVVKFDYPNLRKLNRLSRYPSQPTARWDMQTEQEVFHERR